MGEKHGDEDNDTLFNVAEKHALRNQTHVIRSAYFEIRCAMDYATGIAGVVTHIDENFFRERVGYTSEPGRKAHKPTQSEIKYWIKKLQSIGLIKYHGNYVFELLLADKGNRIPSEKQLGYFLHKCIEFGLVKKSGLTGKGHSVQNKYYFGASQSEAQGTTQKNIDKYRENKEIPKQERREESSEVLERYVAPLYLSLDSNILLTSSLPLETSQTCFSAEAEGLMDYLESLTGQKRDRDSKIFKKRKKCVEDRLSDKRLNTSVDECKRIINFKFQNEWFRNNCMDEVTIFNAANFEKYREALNAPASSTQRNINQSFPARPKNATERNAEYWDFLTEPFRETNNEIDITPAD